MLFDVYIISACTGVYRMLCVTDRYLAGAEDPDALSMRLEADLQLFLNTSIRVLPRWVVGHGVGTLERAEQQIQERKEQRLCLLRVPSRQGSAHLLQQHHHTITERIRLFEIRAGVTNQVHVMLTQICFVVTRFVTL